MSNKKQKRNQRKTGVLTTLMLLLLTLILLVTSTYAWFTSNQTVTIGTIDVNVRASNGLQISVDAETWQPIITKQELLDTAYSGNFNQLPSVITAVSTSGRVSDGTDNIDAGFLNMFRGNISVDYDQGDYVIEGVQSTEAIAKEGIKDFIAFDVFFKLDNGDTTDVYLDRTGSNVVPSSGYTDKGLQNAVRVAFVNEGNVSSADWESARGLRDGTEAIVWEPNCDAHTAAGVQSAKRYFGLTSFTATGIQSFASQRGCKEEFEFSDDGVSKLLLTDTMTSSHFEALQFNSTYSRQTSSAYSNGSSNVVMFQLEPGVTRMRIYMWIEGQDVDCENEASGTNIDFNLQFTITPNS